jgi:protein-L-isoaspartate(D-aspartate) O-methyltransferase
MRSARSLLVLSSIAVAACTGRSDGVAPAAWAGGLIDAGPWDTPVTQAERSKLVRELGLHLRSPRVLDALAQVPRHAFVPDALVARAYQDVPLPIGHDQTISQPFIVGLMTEALALKGGERVLEIGTGSGYQAAVLSVLAKEVYTVELIPSLGDEARARLGRLGYANVHVLVGDGYQGWPEHAPFDRILVTAAPPEVPKTLFDQLAVGGVLVAPIGDWYAGQRLKRYTKTARGLEETDLGEVRFVPMVHEPHASF